MDVLLRYGEVALKGKNRPRFEAQLAANISSLARTLGVACTVRRLSGRLLARTGGPLPFARVFGLHSFSPCTITAAAPDAIEAELALLAPRVAGKRFRISASRSQRGGLSSTEMNRRFGAFLQRLVPCTVSLEAHDVDVGIQVIGPRAYLYTDTSAGFGGLPVGIEGRAGLYVTDDASLLAGLLLLRRGCTLSLIGQACDTALLARFCAGHALPVAHASTLAEAQATAYAAGALALATSQRDPAPHPVGPLPVLTPLIGYDDIRIQHEWEAFACA